MIFLKSHWDLMVKRFGRDCLHIPSGLRTRCLFKTKRQQIDNNDSSGWTIVYVATFFHEKTRRFSIGDLLKIDVIEYEIEDIQPESENKITYVLSKS